MIDKPQTLKEAIAESEKSRIASNLSNLASAYSLMGEEITRLNAEVLRLETIRSEILALDERDPSTITLEETKALYEKSRTNKKL